jgi:hypothetical protein
MHLRHRRVAVEAEEMDDDKRSRTFCLTSVDDGIARPLGLVRPRSICMHFDMPVRFVRALRWALSFYRFAVYSFRRVFVSLAALRFLSRS